MFRVRRILRRVKPETINYKLLDIMKKACLAILMLTTTTLLSAQKVGFVDTDYVLKNLPEYADAQKRLDDIAAGWQKDIDNKYADIDKLYKAFQAEQVLLTDEMKQQKQKDIEDKEKAAKDFQKQKFGYQGELFQKRQELIQPIQDKVYDAIQKIATSKSYDFVLDKSSGSVVLYANAKNNISDQVLQALGHTPKSGDKSSDNKGDKSTDNKSDKK